MIAIDALERGDVVQLVSGSPVMTVRGFKPVVGPGAKKAPRLFVTVVLWSHRHGFIEKDFAAAELKLPSPYRRGGEAVPDEDAEPADPDREAA